MKELELNKKITTKENYELLMKVKRQLEKAKKKKIEYRVNEYITLKLENDHSGIYIKGKRFNQCYYLAFNISADMVQELDEIHSIDEMEQQDHF